MGTEDRREGLQFPGFRRPNYTPVPDELFDVLLPDLRGAELKVLLYIVRRTFGFKKERDAISFNQFLRGVHAREGQVLDGGCGVRDRTTLARALRTLEQMGAISAERSTDDRGESETTIYSLRFAEGMNGSVPASEQSREVVGKAYYGSRVIPQGVVGQSYHGSRDSLPPVVGESYPQETDIQQTERQETEQQQEALEGVVAALVSLGVTRKTAVALTRDYPVHLIEAQMDMLEYRLPRDPAATLIQAIREEWAPPAAYRTPADREACEEDRQHMQPGGNAHSEDRRARLEQWRERVVQEHQVDSATSEVWDRVRSLLLRLGGSGAYDRLLRESVMAPPGRSSVRILLPEAWQKAQLAAGDRQLVEDALLMVLGRACHVDFIYCP